MDDGQILSIEKVSYIENVLLIVFSIIATLAVALRLWARRIQKARFQLNDYLIVLGLVGKLSSPILSTF